MIEVAKIESEKEVEQVEDEACKKYEKIGDEWEQKMDKLVSSAQRIRAYSYISSLEAAENNQKEKA